MIHPIQHLNPDGLIKSPAYSQVVAVSGNGRTIYIGGQNAVNAKGMLIGKDDIVAQTVQVMRNIETAMATCAGGLGNVIKLSIYIVNGQDVNAAFMAAQPFLSQMPNPPVITGIFVSALNRPDYLIEIDATGFIPD